MAAYTIFSSRKKEKNGETLVPTLQEREERKVRTAPVDEAETTERTVQRVEEKVNSNPERRNRQKNKKTLPVEDVIENTIPEVPPTTLKTDKGFTEDEHVLRPNLHFLVPMAIATTAGIAFGAALHISTGSSGGRSNQK